jgi:DNA-binding CsgD family transcriptional regulator
MGNSQRLRAGDVAAAYRLVEECRELGADARVWQRHMLGELCRLGGFRVGAVAETRPTRDGLVNDLSTALDVGWSDAERRHVVAFLTSGEYPPDEYCRRLSRAFVGSRPDQLTRFRRQLIDDADWFRSATCDAHRQLGTGDPLISLARAPGKKPVLCLAFGRAVGDRPIGPREARVSELFCRLARPHLGRGLALAGEPGIAELSRRRRDVLAGLLDGLAEKQVAKRLGLRVPTVHEYVTDLYRHFGVGSRAELLALFLRRRNGPARDWLERFGGGPTGGPAEPDTEVERDGSN